MKQNDSYVEVASVKKSGMANAWREGYQQAGEDWRKRWKTCGLWCLVLCWFSGLVYILQALSSLSAVGGDIISTTACQPDGKFSLSPIDFQFWAQSGFFEITLGFGDLSFTEAKAIDIIWDIFFGRGGQATVAFISWSVFSNYVTTSMEIMPVTFRTYRTVFLQNQSMLIAIPRMIRDFSRRRGLHSKIAMVFMVFTMTFMLVFPTIGGAMTGYKGNVMAYVDSIDDQLVRFQDFQYVLYQIHDGNRIDRGDDYLVKINATMKGDPFLKNEYEATECFNSLGENIDDCYFRHNVSSYVKQTAVGGRLPNESSTFMNRDLPAPRLNISIYRLPEVITPPTGMGQKVNYRDLKRTTWTHSNNLYTVDWVEKNGSCQAKLGYQWGFAFIQLYAMVVLLLIWSFGIYILWLRSHIIMKQRGQKTVAGEYKAVLELAGAIHAQLREHDKEEGYATAQVTESKLRHRISKDLQGGAISYEKSPLSSGDGRTRDPGWGLRAWIMKEKWWLSALILITSGIIAVGISLSLLIVFVFGVPLEIFIAMYIGSTNKSRGIVLLWSFLVLSVLPQIVVIVVGVVQTTSSTRPGGR